MPLAIGLAIVAGVGTTFPQARPVIALLPAGLLALAALYVLTWQIRHSILPGMEWVQEVERAHPVALAAILALPIHPLLAWLWQGADSEVRDRSGEWDSDDAAH